MVTVADSTASEDEATITPKTTSDAQKPTVRHKRRTSEEIEAKVEWTDDDGIPEVVQRKRRKTKARKKGEASTGGSLGVFRDGLPGPLGDGMSRGSRDSPEAGPQNDLQDRAPDYFLHRRAAFSARLASLRSAALRLPPDYSDLDFSPPRAAPRPHFSPASGIQPSRPAQAIPLPESGGVIPAPIAQYLRDYQVAGVGFLHRLFAYQTGGILGDDMGLGKTVQVAAFLAVAFGKTGDARDLQRMRRTRAAGRWYPRVLIVCPGSLLANWQAELQRWGFWHVDVFHGSAAQKTDALQAARAGHIEVLLTTYDTYKNSRSLVNLVEWDALIADECHRLKDGASHTTRAMREVNALCRIGLTGTAIQNNYDELWTLLDWALPGGFGSRAEWAGLVSQPLVLGQSHDATLAEIRTARRTARLLVSRLLPPVFLRRLKGLLADQLPRKTDRVVFCPLTAVQRDAYTRFLAGDDVRAVLGAHEPCACASGALAGWCCRKTTADGRPWRSCVFPGMMTLQKLANHVALLLPAAGDARGKHDNAMRTLETCFPEPGEAARLYAQREAIVTLANPEFCGKWKILKKLLRVWHANGDKVLVFSHSVRLLRMLHLLLSNTSYTATYLDGSLSYDERARAVDAFNGDARQFVFLISTRAGGVGLNITSANKVVIVDPHWNPAHDLQAQDRAYRIGQTRDVDVFRLISAGTIEEIVYARQIYKQQQANIGYEASSERRYFRGVHNNDGRRGEIFGLENIFEYRGDALVLKDIVNKTNVAEAMVGVGLADVDMQAAARDAGLDATDAGGDSRDDEHAMAGLAALVTGDARRPAARRPDPIAALLAEAGVAYTHDNAALLGPSAVEERLCAATAWAGAEEAWADPLNEVAARRTRKLRTVHSVFNPPEDVAVRQFCEMARTMGFNGATEFALAVEGWGKEERERALEEFYRRRREMLEGKDKGVEREGGLEEQKEGLEEESEEKKEENNQPIFILDDTL
ncbi:hypothetical protein TD95_005032 [Thielaviopsis punctulata]|uniref:Uncharacterized protein n=1 Tax=Thielaviopsis punctulata TaxID=72032 RepID=A0A0F4ZIX9_9PEZI|nr:hypothetical protein TD95_005032 [Thielaviopsis punctulata]